MTSSASKKADRIFVQNGRRLYRRSFSATETRIGIVILLALAGILIWVAWKGAHPDPALFMLETDLSQAGSAAPAGWGRGVVPEQLALAGWAEGEVSQFDNDNLYVKINGREGYYKSFGFERLYFLSIVSEANAQTVVDIELYDLGNAGNAVGAYSGERSSEASTVASESGLSHVDRNALYLTRGRYYLRAIGSDESPEVLAQLDQVRARFQQDMAGEPLPWGFALFVGQMGMDPGALSFEPENAFSFGFARNVYTVKLDSGAELFVTPAGSEGEAEILAGKYRDGFRQFGTDERDFIKDRYLGDYATAAPAGAWVVGIRRADDTAAARDALLELAATVKGLPLPADSSEPEATDNVQEDYEADEY